MSVTGCPHLSGTDRWASGLMTILSAPTSLMHPSTRIKSAGIDWAVETWQPPMSGVPDGTSPATYHVEAALISGEHPALGSTTAPEWARLRSVKSYST